MIEWEMQTFVDYAAYTWVIGAPVIGQLTDDDGDGLVTSADTPDIVLVTYKDASLTGVLRIISGDGSTVHMSSRAQVWGTTTYYPYRFRTPAIGDIDGDGAPEIVGTVRLPYGCRVAAWELDGTLAWVYTGDLMGCRANSPSLADLDQDGDVEVIIGAWVLNGLDGSLRGLGAGGGGYHYSYSYSGYHSFGIDMDGDGQGEIIAGSRIYGPYGETVCTTGYADGYPAVANLDSDPEGEFVVTGNGSIRLFEHDSTFIREISVVGGGYGGPPTLADFDGDGDVEIGVAALTTYSVYEVDGTVLWSMPVDDSSSNSTGSSVFDFEGDGQAEVVYADENDLWVYDGATGAVLVQRPEHTSGTVNEYPTIADVDGDGKAEIIVPHNSGRVGLTVYGDAQDNWVSARQTWNQHAYYITNVNDDLSIPSGPPANWPDINTFRQGGFGSAGAHVVALFQVSNTGTLLAPATTEIAAYFDNLPRPRATPRNPPCSILQSVRSSSAIGRRTCSHDGSALWCSRRACSAARRSRT